MFHRDTPKESPQWLLLQKDTTLQRTDFKHAETRSWPYVNVQSGEHDVRL